MGDANVDVVRRIEAAWAENDLGALDDLIAASPVGKVWPFETDRVMGELRTSLGLP